MKLNFEIIFIFSTLVKLAVSINLPPNQLMPFTLEQGTQTIEINVQSKDTTHIIVEAHSSSNLVLSATDPPLMESSVNGTHIGLLQLITNSRLSLYITSNKNVAIPCWLRVNTFQSQNPLPGACNTEYNPRIDPNLHVVYQNLSNSPWYYHVNFALGNVQKQKFPCGNQAVLNSTQYHLYALPLRICGGGTVINAGSLDSMSDPRNKDSDGEQVMKKLVDMTSASSILQSGDYLGSYIADDTNQINGMHPPQFRILRRIGTAYIVVIVMEYRDTPLGTSYYASYVPTVVDECYEHGDCLLIPGVWAKVLAVFICIIGVIITFFGHRWPRLYGALCFVLVVGMIGVPVSQNIDGFQNLGVATLVFLGCVLPLSILCMLLCLKKSCVDLNQLTILPPALLFSILISSTLFFTPLNKLDVFRDYNVFCGVVSGISLVLTILFSYFKEMTLVCSSVTIGSYLSMSALSTTFLTGSLFHYIVIDQYLRIAQPITLSAVVYAPVGLADLLMFTTWGLLLLLVSPIIHCLTRRNNQYHARRRHNDTMDEDRLSESTLRSTVGWLERNPTTENQHSEDQFLFDRDSAALHTNTPSVAPSAPLRPPSYLNYGTYSVTPNEPPNMAANYGRYDERPPPYDVVTSRVITITSNT